MKLTRDEWFGAGRRLGLGLTLWLTAMAPGSFAGAQAVSTTTVQGTVYLANGQVGSGTLSVSWPSFTTADGQAIAAGHTMVTISPDGFVSTNLAPNIGATPAGLYYTVVYYMSDGTTSTAYWVVPAATQVELGSVQAEVMPSAEAVQAVDKAYVTQALAELAGSLLSASGGTLSGNLFLNGDPTQPLQAADKHYVDSTFNMEVPIAGGSMTGPLVLSGDPTVAQEAADKHYVDAQVSTALPISGGAVTGELTGKEIGAVYQADQFPGTDFGGKLQACLGTLSATYGGTCDARNFTGSLSMGSNLSISTANATVLLPCATISTAAQVIVTAGTRNVTLRGCALRGASDASGSQGGTVFLYSGTAAMVQVGDPTYAANTMGFHLDNVVINTTAATSATAQALAAYRTQEMDVESLYLLGNANQTGMTLDGTGNYTGGSFNGDQINGFQTAVNAIGHQTANAATTDWLNASTFVRLHIDCPTSGGSPVAGTIGINLQQGDGNTFTGGDVEGCATALHLGANAQNNTIVGLRNENSTNQIVADVGSSYNNWMTGGTMFAGQLTDNGTRNSFLDTFHRSFNGMKGDWYGSQQDATVTNHFRLGTGTGSERGLLNEIQTDYGYRWLEGYSDASAGEQFYQVQDLFNGVNRLSIGQYNNGQPSTNNQTVLNAAGTGAVVLNGSSNSGTGGVVFGSGGTSETTVATIDKGGNAQFNGTMQVGGTSTLIGTPTVKNQTDAEIDSILWAGLTQSQKESLIYKDWNGNSQWYMVKDASNNWALNSATGGLDSFKAYQSTNSGDTYINSSNASGVVRVNYETGAGSGFNIYGGGSGNLYASFAGSNSIKFPGLASSSGHNCVQIDNSGYITNTGSACSSGVGSVGSGNSGQIAYYTSGGTSIGGMSTVPLASGGTGAANASSALANLGGFAYPGATGIPFGLTSSTSRQATAADMNALIGFTPMKPASNLSDVASPAAALANLGGQAALGFTPLKPASNLSDVASPATALANLGGQAAIGFTPLKPANNLADITSPATALTNLGGISAGGGAMAGTLTAPQFTGPLTGNVVGNVTGNVTGNVAGNVSGTSSNLTGTVLLGNGGTGATTAAGALASLLPGATADGANGLGVSGNGQFSGALRVGGVSTFAGAPTVKNQADTEIDAILWAGLTASQKESLIYTDWNGNNQWYAEKDASNNWALNSAIGGLDSFKAYQSTNGGDTYVNASNSSGTVRVNYETGSGTGFNIYGGGSGNLNASFTGSNSIKFPGLASGAGQSCLQIDNSGSLTNTGSPCGSGGVTGTVYSANSGQIAFYSGNGAAIAGMTTIPMTAGGTGASTAAAGLQNMGGISSSMTSAQSLAGPLNVAGNLSAAAAITARALGGTLYAAQYQTGGGNNGIANAAVGATSQTVIADPTYAATELPTTATFSASPFHFRDNRRGVQVDYFHNPGILSYNWFGDNGQPGQIFNCLFDIPPASTYSGTLNSGCMDVSLTETAPGWSLGNNGITGGGQGWQTSSAQRINHKSNGSGIAESLTIIQNKYGAGDNAAQYNYTTGEGGFTGSSDEGTKAFAENTNEDGYAFTGTITAGGVSGSTSLKTTPVIVGGWQGTGRYLIDTTQTPVTGSITNIGTGFGGSAVSVSATVPVSNAWGTLGGNVATPLVTLPPFNHSQTLSVNVSSGAFDTAHLVCFASLYHDCAFPTSVGTPSGGVQSITIALRRSHAAGSYLFQGGMAGYGLEATAFTQSPNGQPLRYLLDVIGSTGPNTIQVVQWSSSGAQLVPIPATVYQTFNLASGLSSSGTTVTGTYVSAGSTLYRPTNYTGAAVVFAGASGSGAALNNLPCTGLNWTSATVFTCTIGNLTGGPYTSSTTATTSLGNSGGVLNAVNLWPMAEVLDVQNETLSPPQVDGTFALEPNVVGFSNGDTVEEPHHAAAKFQGASFGLAVDNPFMLVNSLQINEVGTGVQGGGSNTGSNAFLNMANEQPDSYYAGTGGLATPPNVFNFAGMYYTGWQLNHGPSFEGGSVLNVSSSATQLNDLNYYFNLFCATDKTNATYLSIFPNSGNSAFNTPGAATWNAASHVFNGVTTFNNTVMLPANGVIAGSYTIPAITVGSDGRITSASNGTVTIPNSGVASGTYSNPNITVGADGRLTAASNGGGSGGFPSVVAHVTLTGQTAANASVLSYTPGAAGVFRTTVSLWLTGSCTSGSINISAFVAPVTGHYESTAASMNCATAFNAVTATVANYNAAGAVIPISTSFNSVVGAPTYGITATIEQLQ